MGCFLLSRLSKVLLLGFAIYHKNGTLFGAAADSDAGVIISLDGDPKIVHRTFGEKELLVIRIEGKDGPSTTASKEQLINDIFNDETIGVSKQFAACSKQQFLLQPAGGSPNIENGVITVELETVEGSTTQSIYREIERLSLNTDYFGRKLEEFDQVMICMPQGVVKPELNEQKNGGKWLAYVPTEMPYKNYMSIYNDEWCSSVSAGMHEIGHTIGLGHSGEESSYDDVSGQMGFSKKQQIGADKCFNPAKSWQLGWYAKQSLRLDPLLDEMPVSTVLMGITSDFDNDRTDSNSNKKHILLQIYNGGASDDFYIGYNRRESFNAGTAKGQDMLLVNEQAAGGVGRRDSKLLANLDVNESFRFENYRGIAGKTLVVAMKERVSDMEGALVEIYFEDENPHISDGCLDRKNKARFEVSVLTDDYPEDTSWTLTKNETGEIVASRSKGSYFEPTSSSVDWACLDRDGSSYTFALFDTYGDGLCCNDGLGGYSVFLDGKELFRGGEFSNTQSVHHSFEIPDRINLPEESTPNRGECEDDLTYRFNNKLGRDCEWVGRHESRRKQKCDRNDPKTSRSIRNYCPSVCLDACHQKKRKRKNKRKKRK